MAGVKWFLVGCGGQSAEERGSAKNTEDAKGRVQEGSFGG